MTLDLRCPQCFSRLNVPDEAAAASAKCPHCSEVFDVDAHRWSDKQATTSTASPEEPLSQTEKRGDRNPYAAPSSDNLTESHELPKAPMEHGLLDARASLTLAWEIYRANFGTMILSHGLVLFVWLSLSQMANQLRDQGASFLALCVDVPLSSAVMWFFMIGLTHIGLRAARGAQAIEFHEIFKGIRKYPSVCLYMVLYALMIMIGSLLLLIPGIYIAVRFWAGVHFIVDRNVGFMDAFRLSDRFVEGNVAQSFLVGFYLLTAMLFASLTAILGPLVVFGLAAVLPMSTLLWAVSFLMITRQPIARMIRA